MLRLNSENIDAVFSIGDALDAARNTARLLAEEKCTIPSRLTLRTACKTDMIACKGTILYMPCYIEQLRTSGVKIVSNFPTNADLDLPTTPATMILVDNATGIVNCILDGTRLTQLRTAAAAGVATDLLARQNARIAALIGAGGQGLFQLRGLMAVRKLSEIRIYDVCAERAESLRERFAGECDSQGVEIRTVATSAEAVTGADIITTVTRSATPVFDGALVKQGVHINAIGSYLPERRELDACILKRASKIFFDSQKAVMEESGDVMIPLSAGEIFADRFSGDIGELLMGRLAGREGDDEITIFKSVGIAAADLVTANDIYERALQRHIGVTIP